MHAACMQFVGKLEGGNSLSAGDIWAWGNTLPGETYITVTCGLVGFSDICVGKHGSLGICVRGNAIHGKHISLWHRYNKPRKLVQKLAYLLRIDLLAWLLKVIISMSLDMYIMVQFWAFTMSHMWSPGGVVFHKFFAKLYFICQSVLCMSN